jgi:hypothetical protein
MMSLHRYCAWLTGLVLTLSYVLAVAQNTIELQPDKGLLVIDGHPFVLQGSTVIGPDRTCRTSTGDWSCGQAAWQALEERVRSGIIICTPLGSLTGSTTVPVPAECAVNNENLNAWLVRRGWALSDDTSSALFVSEENAAQAEQLGIWRDGFAPPSHWRALAIKCSACSARHQSIVRTRELRQQSSPANNSN